MIFRFQFNKQFKESNSQNHSVMKPFINKKSKAIMKLIIPIYEIFEKPVRKTFLPQDILYFKNNKFI